MRQQFIKIIKMEPLPLRTRSTESGNKNFRETISALEPHNILTRPGSNRFSEIEPLLLGTRSTESGNTNYRRTTSALEPQNVLTRPGNINKT